MTVKQLIRKLKSIPEDYEVTLSTTHYVFEGLYKADSVEVDDDYRQYPEKVRAVYQREKEKNERRIEK